MPVTDDMPYSRALSGYVEDLKFIVENIAVRAVGGSWATEIAPVIVNEFRLPRWLPPVTDLRSYACVNFEEGLVVVTGFDRYAFCTSFGLMFCNVNELRCVSRVIGCVDEVLLAPLVAEAAERAVERVEEDSWDRGMLLEVIRFSRKILAPIRPLLTGEKVDWRGLVEAVQLMVGEKPGLARPIVGLIPRIARKLERGDRERFLELAGRAIEAGRVSEWPTIGSLKETVLASERDEKNSLMPGNVAGEICIIEHYVKEGGLLSLEPKDVIDMYCEQFRSREIFVAVREVARRLRLDNWLLKSLRELDNTEKFEGISREDLVKLVKTALEATAESFQKGDIASRTVKLSDGRKLHVITPRKESASYLFLYSILLLANHEIKAMYLTDFIDKKRFKNDKTLLNELTWRLKVEDLAKLDEETLDTILELLAQRALMESVS